MTDYKPKLIEVALPLAAINEAAGAEGSVGQRPHPKNLHRWWARRPLAAARAVIWASLIDDPSGDESLSPAEQEAERNRLFGILERLVQWDNSTDAVVLAEARAEIDRCFPDGAPPVLDPFGGGGAIPFEAQRLGLTALSGDLNPVAVLIQKAMIEIPPRFAGRAPVHPDSSTELTTWERAQGLAVDVAAYGGWLQDQARNEIGHLYAPVTSGDGQSMTPVAWIWARTVESPDPSWSGHVPLVASWTLADKRGKPKIWVEPIVDREAQVISFEVREGGSPTFDETVDRGGGFCIATGAAIPFSYIRDEAQAGRMGTALMAIVAHGSNGRGYCSASSAEPFDLPDIEPPVAGALKGKATVNVGNYGFEEWWQLFTPRQLVALSTLSDLLPQVHERVRQDAATAGIGTSDMRLRDGGSGALAYADAVVTYLAFVIDKLADFSNSLCSWNQANSQLRYLFSRQAVAMTWDFAEVNPFSGMMSSFDAQLDSVANSIRDCLAVGNGPSSVRQREARSLVREYDKSVAISTDPPYYDNICYADLSDFFYVWLRRNLAEIWPDECATLLTPKADELIANLHHAGSKAAAEHHFESGMAEFMADVALAQCMDAPATIYYAYKATETKAGKVRSTGWDTFLQGVVDARLTVTATWPVRTERQGRTIAIGKNALASSIVLACRPRSSAAPMASRGEFIAALREELPEAVRILQSGNIAPVDIAQSTIGPGIKVFSGYAKVVEADGSAMSVSAALGIINDVLGEVLDGEEAELDPDSRFAVTWYGQNGYNPGNSGDADSQARAKNTSLAGIQAAGVGEARGGNFRLFERHELDEEWSPTDDNRLTVWEATQHLVTALERSESEAVQLLRRLGGFGDRARQLAYLLFHKATDKGWAEEATAYNTLITAWPALQAGASGPESVDGQQRML